MATPTDFIAFHARMSPRRLAARDLVLDQDWSYAELDRLVGRLATALAARGCVAGERVAVLARNSVWQVALHHACARLGAAYVPLNWRLAAVELAALLERVRPRLFLGDALAAAFAPDATLAGFVEEAAACAPLQGAGAAGRTSLILFTSGTSGRPKGVMLSEDNLQQTALNFGVSTRVDAASSFLCEAPMFHVIGLVVNVRPVLMVGGSIQVSDGFEPQRTLAWLSDPARGLTHYVGVPQMMAAFRAQPGFDPAPLRRLTALVSGGAPQPPEAVAAWLDEGVAMVAGFGMSEAGTVFGMPVDPQVLRAKLGSVGVPAPSLRTRVVDPRGRDCATGTPGELLLRGPNLGTGYWEDPAATTPLADADGWFATGDVVRCDADGFFWVVDRKKDMYISGGENVYPAEIEAALADYPGIAECAVIGLPDPTWGEAGHLLIVPEREGLRVEEVLAFLGARLARYKLPRHVRMVAALPRTATGKLQKARLKDLAGAGTPGGDADRG